MAAALARIDDHLVFCGEAAANSGKLGLPDPQSIADACKALRAKLDSGEIRPGRDQLVLLDVGPHASDPDTHREQWLQIRRAATAEHPLETYMCTGFDNLAERRMRSQLIRGQPISICRHDETFNRALVEAATGGDGFAGATHVIDIAGSLARFHQQAKGMGASAYLADGIHLNIWGQLHLCASICRAVAPERRAKLSPIRKLIKRSWPLPVEIAPAVKRKDALELIDAAFEFETDLRA